MEAILGYLIWMKWNIENSVNWLSSLKKSSFKSFLCLWALMIVGASRKMKFVFLDHVAELIDFVLCFFLNFFEEKNLSSCVILLMGILLILLKSVEQKEKNKIKP